MKKMRTEERLCEVALTCMSYRTSIHVQVFDALRKAGFVYNGSWLEFLTQFDANGDGFIGYNEFLSALKIIFEDS